MNESAMAQANRQLMGSGKPAISWADATEGTTVKGKVLDAEVTQQTDFRTREPIFWPSGDPRMQVVVTLLTEMRDPNLNGDNGERRLYIAGRSMQNAVRDACRAAGVDGLAVGGTLAVQFVGEGERSAPGMNPPKLFKAAYQPPQVLDGLI